MSLVGTLFQSVVMSASPLGANVNAIVKLLSEKSVADVRQGAKLLRDYVHEHGSSARSELLQWGVVHSIMTLLTEASKHIYIKHSSHTLFSPLMVNTGLKRSPQNRRIPLRRASLFKPQLSPTGHRSLYRDCIPVATF
jgi:hypothetical protein